MKKAYVLWLALCLSASLQATDPGSGLSRKKLVAAPVRHTLLGRFASEIPDSRQGAAVFGEYLFQAHDKGMCDIFDLLSGKKLRTVRLLPAREQNHANNICFSDRRYGRTDQFPLLYVSENKTRGISVNRLASLDGTVEQVQYITLPAQIGYFLNAVIDPAKDFIYTVCFRSRNWRTADDGNRLIVSRLRLPDISEGDVAVEVIDQFELPFHTATQGAFFTNGLIVHGFGINTNEHDGLVVIDPKKKRIVREIGTHDAFNDEIEGVAPYRGGVLVTLQHGNVFRMDFK